MDLAIKSGCKDTNYLRNRNAIHVFYIHLLNILKAQGHDRQEARGALRNNEL